ncbi:ABC transporter permease [Baekduia sp.]|uniref:ABC transporter permease n=1 Tax=Baekduia sp. TaxID=2600305 RepID=UPI002DFB9F3C|nr:ABC transporter permease [Baekduia sp.]
MKRLATRLIGIAVVVVAATTCAWIMFHLLRPQLFKGQEDSLPRYLERAFLHFDFGRSQEGAQRPVADLIREGLPADVSLIAGGLLFGVVAGVGGGILCARRPRGAVSQAMQAIAMVALCAPVYVVGLMALLLFGAEIGRFDLGVGIPLHYVDFDHSPTGWLGALIVPWIVVGLPLAGMCLRVMLGQMVEVSDEDYIRAARAKGLSDGAVLRRHVAPVALGPTAMLASSAMPLLITNAVLVEQVFSVPGVFRDLTHSIGTSNTTLILGMTAVGALLIATTTLLFDLLQVWLDPRVRAREASS